MHRFVPMLVINCLYRLKVRDFKDMSDGAAFALLLNAPRMEGVAKSLILSSFLEIIITWILELPFTLSIENSVSHDSNGFTILSTTIAANGFEITYVRLQHYCYYHTKLTYFPMCQYYYPLPHLIFLLEISRFPAG